VLVSEIARVLRPGGTVLILVPARPELWSYWDQMHGYHRRYTKKILAGVFDASWALEHLEYSFPWMYPVVWSFRMMMRRRRSAEGHSDIIEVPRRARSVGTSRVGLAGLTELVLDGLLGFSALPLRLAIVAAVVLAVAALVGITAISCIKLFTDLAEPMWSSIMTVVFFSSSVQFFLIGLLGEYTARIYSEVKQRPHFIVRKRY
jgi:hypothetical protein